MTIKTTLTGKEFIFETKAGLFSKDRVDPGSMLLIENVDVQEGENIVDLGCGYGVIGLALARISKTGKVYLVDTDIRAVEYTLLNAQNNQIENILVFASDGFAKIPKDLKCDVVVSNPPSHTPKEVLLEFIDGAKKHLNPEGRLYFVTEKRIVPFIKREFERVFGNYQMVAAKNQYVLSLARA